MTTEIKKVMGQEIAGDDIEERAARIRRIEMRRMKIRDAAIGRGEDPDAAEERWDADHEVLLVLPAADAATVNGVYYETPGSVPDIARADAVRAALTAAGIGHHYPGTPEAQRVLRAAGLA